MLIYPQFVNGERLARCSDEAQMHFPRLASIANGFGRMELSYRSILQAAYATIANKPTKEQLLGWIQEFRQQRLLFAYMAPDGTPWAEWCEIPSNALPRFKTAEDKKSPSPLAEALAAFVAAGREERRRSAEDDGDFLSLAEDFGNAPKTSEESESVPKISPVVVVVGVEEVVEEEVEVEGKRKDSKPVHVMPSRDGSPTKAEVAQEFVDAWNQNCGRLAKVTELTPERVDKCHLRALEGVTAEQIAEVAALADRTPFCRGEGKPRRPGEAPWRCTFNFVVKNASNRAKVIDQEYGEPDVPPKVWKIAGAEEWDDVLGPAGLLESEGRASA